MRFGTMSAFACRSWTRTFISARDDVIRISRLQRDHYQVAHYAKQIEMDEYTAQLIEGARATYQEVVAGKGSRIDRGTVLWNLFERSAEASEAVSKLAERKLTERINEVAVGPLQTIKAFEEESIFGIKWQPKLLQTRSGPE